MPPFPSASTSTTETLASVGAVKPVSASGVQGLPSRDDQASGLDGVPFVAPIATKTDPVLSSLPTPGRSPVALSGAPVQVAPRLTEVHTYGVDVVAPLLRTQPVTTTVD